MTTEQRPRIEIPGGGFVELLNVMGDDLAVANAARVSMAKESAWELVEAPGDCMALEQVLSERDRKLIGYLARSDPPHFTPFTHPQIQFRIRMPVFVERQWFKSQIGLTRNSVSRRYVDDAPELWEPSEWRERAENVKQGSGGALPELRAAAADHSLHLAYDECRRAYESLLRIGVCPEQARTVLPIGMMTEFWETGSLYAYARIIRLRDEAHAQHETGEYARAIRALIEPQFPVSVAALLGEQL